MHESLSKRCKRSTINKTELLLWTHFWGRNWYTNRASHWYRWCCGSWCWDGVGASGGGSGGDGACGSGDCQWLLSRSWWWFRWWFVVVVPVQAVVVRCSYTSYLVVVIVWWPISEASVASLLTTPHDHTLKGNHEHADALSGRSHRLNHYQTLFIVI